MRRRRVYHGIPDGRTVPYAPPSVLWLAVRAHCSGFLSVVRQPTTEELVNEPVAKVLEACGVRPGCSTGIDDSLTRGYGRLDANGFWEFPL
jgi:hypothetical protein